MKTRQKYFVYILKCRDKTLYCGMTNDLIKRELQHNSGKGSAYVRSRGGGKIIYSEIVKSLSVALKREAQIKKMSREAKLLLTKAGK